MLNIFNIEVWSENSWKFYADFGISLSFFSDFISSMVAKRFLFVFYFSTLEKTKKITWQHLVELSLKYCFWIKLLFYYFKRVVEKYIKIVNPIKMINAITFRWQPLEIKLWSSLITDLNINKIALVISLTIS